MSLPDVAKTLDEYLARQPVNQPEIQTIEFSAKGFSRSYYISYQSDYGNKNIKAKLETGNEVEFEYWPITVTRSKSDISLDQSFDFGFGANNDLVLKELKSHRKYIEDNDLISTHPDYFPKIVYRSFNYLNLEEPLDGPIVLELKKGSFKNDSDGMVFAATAEAPASNNNKTGITYNLTDFPMLRGYFA